MHDQFFFKSLKKALECFDKALDGILVVMFLFIFLMISIQITGRYFVNFSIMFAEELARYIFIWIVYLGSARAFVLKRHILVNIFINKIKKRFRIYIEITLNIMIMLFLFYVFLEGIKYSGFYWEDPFSSTRFLKLGWAYAIIPIASILMILNILRVVLEEILYKK